MGAVEERLAELGPGRAARSCRRWPPTCPRCSTARGSTSRARCRWSTASLAESGHVGEGDGLVSPERAKELAAVCALNAIAAVKSVVGDLDRVERVVKVVGFVASDPSFTGQPGVVNGASRAVRRGVRRGRACTRARPSASPRCRSGRRSRSRSSSTSATDRRIRRWVPSRRRAPGLARPRARRAGRGVARGARDAGRAAPRAGGDGHARARRGCRAGGLRAAPGRVDGLRAVDDGLPRWRGRPGRPRADRCRRPGWRSSPRRWGSTSTAAAPVRRGGGARGRGGVRGAARRSPTCAGRAHWVTPEFEPRRYDTWILAAGMPAGPGGHRHDAPSPTTAPGCVPRDLLDRHAAGEVRMLPPTVVSLERLAGVRGCRRLPRRPAAGGAGAARARRRRRRHPGAAHRPALSPAPGQPCACRECAHGQAMRGVEARGSAAEERCRHGRRLHVRGSGSGGVAGDRPLADVAPGAQGPPHPCLFAHDVLEREPERGVVVHGELRVAAAVLAQSLARAVVLEPVGLHRQSQLLAAEVDDGVQPGSATCSWVSSSPPRCEGADRLERVRAPRCVQRRGATRLEHGLACAGRPPGRRTPTRGRA